MKRLGFVVLLCLLVTPSLWSAKKVSVGELRDMLKSMQQANKSDAVVASALKQLQLSEELTPPVMNSLVGEAPGKLTTEQIYVLEARSAMLAPPPSEIPAEPAPDENAQKAMLDKVDAYVTKTYGQLPALMATKTTLRFQDNVEAVAPSSGLHGSAMDVSVGSAFVNAYQFVHYINATDAEIASSQGAEKLPEDKTRWGANRMIALQEPDPTLTQVFSEARKAATIRWLRWELVDGKKAAVYAFTVPRKGSRFAVNVCCFPNVDQTGRARFSSASMPGGGGVQGDMQTNTQWNNFKAVVPYQGELFVDPESGTVLRMITQAEFKPSDVVHQLDTRVDYGAVTIENQSLVLPVRKVIDTEVVPTGDSGAGRYSTRCTLFTSEYKNYRRTAATRN